MQSEAASVIPQFWAEYIQSGKDNVVCSMYGISIDENMGGNKFEYLIADNYNPVDDIAEGFITKIIPQHTWAVFACSGAMPASMQDVQEKIFSQWLPGCQDYEIAAGYNIEMYSNPDAYPNGTQNAKYYSEVWVPVKKK